MIRLLTATLVLSVALAGCATSPPAVKIEPRIVEVPIAVPCDVNAGPDPDYPDTPERVAAATGVYELVKLLLAGRELRIPREKALKSTLTACGGKAE